jgi:predicted heme/steroid binding protein
MIMRQKIVVLFSLISALALFLLSWFFAPGIAFGQATSTQNFSAEELTKYNGKDGQPAYFAFKGKVYDVTKSDYWKEGNHYGLQAGADLTEKLSAAPHGEEVLAPFPVVGTFGESEVRSDTSPAPVAVQPATARPSKKLWYEGRIKIFNLTLLAWTGVLLGVFFFLNFATCFALPWSKLPVPWKGTRPGADSLDASPVHQKWTVLHKYFAWLTVIFGVLHGVLGILQLFGYYL